MMLGKLLKKQNPKCKVCKVYLKSEKRRSYNNFGRTLTGIAYWTELPYEVFVCPNCGAEFEVKE